MKFNNLKVSNFRGIDYAELKELKHLNLIVGKNNSGKTSILEAIFVLSGMSNPEILLNINAIRNFRLTNDNDFRYIFNILNLEKPIELSGKVDNIERALKISPYKDTKRIIGTHKNNPPFAQANMQGSFYPFAPSFSHEAVRLENKGRGIDGLKLSFKNNGRDQEDVYISLKNETIYLSSLYKEVLNVRYLNSQILLMNGIIDLSSMIRKKQINVGKEELFPINVMGDGIIRTLAVLSSMYDMEGGILLLDEVENGLHYSSIAVLWKAILRLLKKLDIQIIATTHSYEALSVLVDTKEELESFNEKTPEVSLYRIERNEDKTKTIHFDNDDFIFGLNQNYEVR